MNEREEGRKDVQKGETNSAFSPSFRSSSLFRSCMIKTMLDEQKETKKRKKEDMKF